MRNILTIIKKELKRFFTDKRMLATIFLPGILIYVVYSLMGSGMTAMMQPEISEFVYYVINEPVEFGNMFSLMETWEPHKNPDNLSHEEIISEIKEGNISIYIIYEEDFLNKVNNYVFDAGNPSKAPEISIYYNSADEISSTIYQYVTTFLSSFESSIANKFDINSDLSIDYDQATEDDMTRMLMSMLMPLLLIIFLFSGAMSFCSESVSGEKERGTIATLLVTPIKRSYLAIGKICALSIVSLCCACVSFIGLILSVPKLMGSSLEMDLSIYNASVLVPLLIIVILTVLVFTTILTLISTYAKSVKEATSLSTPLMIVVMMVAVVSMFSNGASNLWLYAIPIYNSVQCISDVFSLTVNIPGIIIASLVNVFVIGLGVLLLTRMFNSEKVMFNK